MMILINCLTACSLQNMLLYYPSPLVPSAKELAEEQIDFWPSGRTDYRGFIGKNEIKEGRGTVIVFHGNAGHAADRAFYVHFLAPLGLRVILAEYPGYGARPGELGEASFVADARETLKLALAHYGRPIYVLGESLGSGVAAALAGQEPDQIAGIFLITPWDSLAKVAKAKFPLLPVKLFLRDRYDNIANLEGFPGKVAVIAAERDEIIPLTHALNLFESIGAPKKLWIVPQAGHNDWMLRVGVLQWREYLDFMERFS